MKNLEKCQCSQIRYTIKLFKEKFDMFCAISIETIANHKYLRIVRTTQSCSHSSEPGVGTDLKN